ncbi:hypothetical protein [Xanthobacter variabilis]|uniref:hypothetical protein n=1 Tax=Xanthobacter variabilis TaxID=3119932 RepID=UPI0037282BC4
MTNVVDIALVLFAKNWAGKGQGGRFSVEEAERASAAALKHGASVIAFTATDDADLLAALPDGRFGENDRPLLTAIKQDIYKRLVALADCKAGGWPQASTVQDAAGDCEKAEPKKPRRKKAGAAMAARADETATEPAAVSIVMRDGKTHWPALKPGDLVLAPDFGDEGYNGWWEATVKARSETHVTLDWKDYPELPTFTRPITQITLPHPECKL